jgi:hypothetical protein
MRPRFDLRAKSAGWKYREFAHSRQNYLTGAAESSGTVGAKLHGVLRSDAATIHADAASKKLTKVSDH